MGKLFELNSNPNVSRGEQWAPIQPGNVSSLIYVVTKDCIPLVMCVQPETRRHFTVVDVSIDRQPVALTHLSEQDVAGTLSLAPAPAPALAGDILLGPLTWVGALWLFTGRDFVAQVRNDSDEPRHFECEVWGELAR